MRIVKEKINQYIIKSLESLHQNPCLSTSYKASDLIVQGLFLTLISSVSVFYYVTLSEVVLQIIAFWTLCVVFILSIGGIKFKTLGLILVSTILPYSGLFYLMSPFVLHSLLSGKTERDLEVSNFLQNQRQQASQNRPMNNEMLTPINELNMGPVGFSELRSILRPARVYDRDMIMVEQGNLRDLLDRRRMERQHDLESLYKPHPALAIAEEFEKSPDLYLNKHFNSTSHFKRFFLERIKENGEINGAKLFFFSLIPKKKSLPIDFLREIVLAANLLTKYQISRKSFEILSVFNVDEYFEKLSHEQIRMIFTRPFSFVEYIELLLDLSKYRIPLEPAITMRELIDYAPHQAVKAEARLTHKYLRNLPKVNKSDLKFTLISTKREYDQTSQTFSNCVRGYHTKNGSDVFTVFDGPNPVACVEIVSDIIIQLEGPRNHDVPKAVRKIIEDTVRAAKNFKD